MLPMLHTSGDKKNSHPPCVGPSFNPRKKKNTQPPFETILTFRVTIFVRFRAQAGCGNLSYAFSMLVFGG